MIKAMEAKAQKGVSVFETVDGPFLIRAQLLSEADKARLQQMKKDHDDDNCVIM